MDAKTANPDERELDLSQPVEFLIPFVDINWEKEKHYTMDIAYTLEIEFSERPWAFLSLILLNLVVKLMNNVWNIPRSHGIIDRCLCNNGSLI